LFGPGLVNKFDSADGAKLTLDLTWDPKTNERAYREGGFILPGYRLDRIYFKSSNIEIVSSEILKGVSHNHVSDHFGSQSVMVSGTE
jgi:endonuclease/exonuclease/phosphatase family metal-dependent hydrolase